MKIKINDSHSKLANSLLNINLLAEVFKTLPLPTEPITNIATLLNFPPAHETKKAFFSNTSQDIDEDDLSPELNMPEQEFNALRNEVFREFASNALIELDRHLNESYYLCYLSVIDLVERTANYAIEACDQLSQSQVNSLVAFTRDNMESGNVSITKCHKGFINTKVRFGCSILVHDHTDAHLFSLEYNDSDKKLSVIFPDVAAEFHIPILNSNFHDDFKSLPQFEFGEKPSDFLKSSFVKKVGNGNGANDFYREIIKSLFKHQISPLPKKMKEIEIYISVPYVYNMILKSHDGQSNPNFSKGIDYLVDYYEPNYLPTVVNCIALYDKREDPEGHNIPHHSIHDDMFNALIERGVNLSPVLEAISNLLSIFVDIDQVNALIADRLAETLANCIDDIKFSQQESNTNFAMDLSI